MKSAAAYPTPEFTDIYRRLTQRFSAAPPPQPLNSRALAISQVVMAFQHLQDTLQRLAGIHRNRMEGSAPLARKDMQASLENLLQQLGALAQTAQESWQSDLLVLVDRAQAAREIFDHLLLFRLASPRAFLLMDLPEALATPAQIEQFGSEVVRLDAAFFALGAEYVLDCHNRGLGLDGLPLPSPAVVKPLRNPKRPRRK